MPAVIVALALLWAGDFSPKTRWTVAVLAVVWWLAVSGTIGERVIRPLQTISNLLAALREGDYSIRARGARTDEALGLAYFEVNALADVLRGQRLGALEATAVEGLGIASRAHTARVLLLRALQNWSRERQCDKS